MPKLTFTDAEKGHMKSAVASGHEAWSEQYLSGIKKKLKEQHLTKQFNCCCYCSRDLKGEFKLVIDIEHILPKSIFTNHMFTPKNLSVACKRCNMNIKQADVSFLTVATEDLPNRVFRSQFYKFVHPNLDNIEAHLNLEIVRLSRRKKIIKYVVLNESSKGQFNYDYFKLKRLEENAFDEAQDLPSRAEVKNSELAHKFEELVRLLNR